MEKPILNIDTLIGQFVVINIPGGDSKNSDLSHQCLIESVTKALESVLKEIPNGVCKNIADAQTDYYDNTLQTKRH